MDKMFYLTVVLIGLALFIGFIKAKQLEKRIKEQNNKIIEIKEIIKNGN